MRLFKMMMGLLLGLALSGLVQAEDWLQPGHDYLEVDPPVVMVSPDGKVTVVELFWYGCPACYIMEPHVENWLKDKPEHIDFVRLPAIFNNPHWALHAQAYYAAEDLGVLDKFHTSFFHAVNQQRRPMSTQGQLRSFFAELGVSAEKFDRSFSSFKVQTRVRQAADQTARYGISGVPAVAVNGRYVVDGPMAGSYENLFKTVNILAERELSRQAAR